MKTAGNYHELYYLVGVMFRLFAILSRLNLKPENWLTTMAGWRSMNGGGVGTPERRTEEAQRRGKSWVKNQCPLFAVGA